MKSLTLILFYLGIFTLLFFIFSIFGMLWYPWTTVIHSSVWFTTYAIYIGSWLAAIPAYELYERLYKD